MGSLGDHAVGRVGAMVAMVVLLGTLQAVPPASATSNGVLGWGADESGQLGRGTFRRYYEVPQPVSSETTSETAKPTSQGPRLQLPLLHPGSRRLRERSCRP
jgi:hypothetical protein